MASNINGYSGIPGGKPNMAGANEIQATKEELTKKTAAGQRADAMRAEIAPAQIEIAEKTGSYKYDSYQYPLQLDGPDQRFKHWVTFFINVNTVSATAESTVGQNIQTSGSQTVEGVRQVIQQVGNELQTIKPTNNDSGVVVAGKLAAGAVGMGVSAIGSLFKGKKTRRTTTAIRLYMPSTLSQSFKQDYFSVSVTEAGGLPLAASQLGASAIEGLLAGDMTRIGKSLSDVSKSSSSSVQAELAKTLADKMGSSLGFGKGVGDLIMQGSGSAVNPNEEVLYKQPQFRHHAFTFDFYPRSETESQNVRNIIRRFKMHAAPELKSGAGTRYFITPSQFEIEFSINDGKPQDECRIGKVGLCVLDDITLDYAPDEFSVYYDDSPTHIRMQLSFKEIEYITRDMIANKGF